MGEKILLSGESGCGKSTLLKLLMRFYEPDSGYISIDGKPIREMKRSEVRKLFGMVLQDTWLFYGTVYENIVYGRENATLQEVKKKYGKPRKTEIIESVDEQPVPKEDLFFENYNCRITRIPF